MRSVVGPLPPPVQRPSAPRLSRFRRRRLRARGLPRRAATISPRLLVAAALACWAGMLALFDWGLGGLRLPHAPMATSGRAAVAPAEEPPATRVPAIPGTRRPFRAPGSAPPAGGGSPAGLAPLIVPVATVDRSELRDQFDEPRSGGHRHQALDILAPRNTPVIAAAAGTIDKLFTSKAGGLTLYQRDESDSFELYYAHLEAYMPGLSEGDHVEQGQVIGFVGSSGNAPRDVPHLHFAIFRLGPQKRWWEGAPIDPYPLLVGR
jgi:murein DD-endopeptidase MepM/ murein hydrolase activator NlpD